MRTLISTFILLLFTISSCHEKIRTEDVPLEIRNKFGSLYPRASKEKWQKEVKSYEVSFVNNNHHLSVSFDLNGNLTEIEEGIKKEEVPQKVLEMFQLKYPKATVISFSKRKSRQNVFYLVDMKIKNEEYKVFFSPTGQLVKQVVKVE